MSNLIFQTTGVQRAYFLVISWKAHLATHSAEILVPQWALEIVQPIGVGRKGGILNGHCVAFMTYITETRKTLPRSLQKVNLLFVPLKVRLSSV